MQSSSQRNKSNWLIDRLQRLEEQGLQCVCVCVKACLLSGQEGENLTNSGTQPFVPPHLPPSPPMFQIAPGVSGSVLSQQAGMCLLGNHYALRRK